MTRLLVYLLLFTTFTGIAQKNDTANTVGWLDFNAGSSNSPIASELYELGINISVNHHLFGLSTYRLPPLLDIFGPNGDPKLNFSNIWYGYIDIKEHSLWYVKSGLTFTHNYTVSDTIPGTGFLGSDSYKYKSKLGMGAPLEAGIGFKFLSFTSVFYITVILRETKTFTSLGIKVGGMGSFTQRGS
ncbi:MAG: hypothetical protein RLP14_10135 [Owenweeksia sp.]